MLLLVLVVASLLFMLGLMLSVGVIYAPVSSLPFNLTPAREGIELAVIPLAAVVAAVVPPPADRIKALPTSRIGHWLPLLAAVALVALFLLIASSWYITNTDTVARVWQFCFFLVRVLWVVPAMVFTYGFVMLYPRLGATLAGAIGVPGLFGVVALGFPESLVRSLEAHHGRHLALPWPMSTGPEGVFMVTAGAAVAVALLAAALLAANFRVWPRTLCYGVVSGAIMLYLAVYGYVFVLATLD